MIKEVKGIKIGIFGLTNPAAISKSGELDFIEPQMAAKTAVGELKKNGAQVIVALSRLGHSDDLKLLQEVSGIDILIGASSNSNQKPAEKNGSTIILQSDWEGRRLGKLSLIIKGDKIVDYKVENLRLFANLNDDPEILSILPRCFKDADCIKSDSFGKCLEPGSSKASCNFSPLEKINLSIVLPKECIACGTENMINQYKPIFPGMVISYLYYPEAGAKDLIAKVGAKSLPVYLFSKDIEKSKSFSDLKERFEQKGDFYLLKPKFGGAAVFLERKKEKGALDIFISLFDKDTPQLLEAIKKFNPRVHFLVIKRDAKLQAPHGDLEVEEDLRALSVQKYYPEIFWDYISCRAKNINSSWWEDCLGKLSSDKIKACAKGDEGKALLEKNIILNNELEIMFGPTYLVDNQQLFSTQGAPTEKDFDFIFKKIRK